MAKQRGRESSAGLIITLVFFILTSIGLGVATYYGYQQQAILTANAAAAVNLQKDAEAQLDWYKFQAMTYRTYLGQTKGIDDTELKVFRDHYDANQLGKDSKHEFPDRAAVKDVIDTVEGEQYLVVKDDKGKPIPPPVLVKMTWDKDAKGPKTNYEKIFHGLMYYLDYQTQQTTAALDAQKKAEDAAKSSDEEKVKAMAKDSDEIHRLTLQNNVDLAKERKDNADLRNTLDAANKATADAVQAGEDKVKDVKKLFQGKDQKIQELTAKLGDLQDRLDATSKKDLDAPSNGRPIPTDWKIVKMDPTGRKPFINMGTADNVKPPLSFSIHGRGPDGQPLPASKGTLEVINVLSDHLAQTQVKTVKDSAKDPILEGDYLFNPIFKPGAEQHVVIAGRIDMHGNKLADDLEEFERLLKRQNVVVDGYVDPQDGSVKGKLTVGTDYLILGDREVAEGAAKTSIDQLVDQARSNGVRIISLREFLDSIGYRTP